MSGDGQSRESVQPSRVSNRSFRTKTYEVLVWRQSRDFIGKLPSVKESKCRLLTAFVLSGTAVVAAGLQILILVLLYGSHPITTFYKPRQTGEDAVLRCGNVTPWLALCSLCISNTTAAAAGAAAAAAVRWSYHTVCDGEKVFLRSHATRCTLYGGFFTALNSPCGYGSMAVPLFFFFFFAHFYYCMVM